MAGFVLLKSVTVWPVDSVRNGFSITGPEESGAEVGPGSGRPSGIAGGKVGGLSLFHALQVLMGGHSRHPVDS